MYLSSLGQVKGGVFGLPEPQFTWWDYWHPGPGRFCVSIYANIHNVYALRKNGKPKSLFWLTCTAWARSGVVFLVCPDLRWPEGITGHLDQAVFVWEFLANIHSVKILRKKWKNEKSLFLCTCTAWARSSVVFLVCPDVSGPDGITGHLAQAFFVWEFKRIYTV